MNSMDASQRKKGIRLIGAAVGFMMTSVLAVAQTTAVTTSGPSAGIVRRRLARRIVVAHPHPSRRRVIARRER